MASFEIMFNDLNEEAQKAFLKHMHIDNPSEGNYDVVPIATIDYNDGERAEADEVICFYNADRLEDVNGCLLINPCNLDADSKTVDVHTVENLNHYTRYRVRADKGRNGETILEPIGFEYDDEQAQKHLVS